MAPPLYGLVLAGGRSTRMRRDKATLSYQGRNQLDRAMELLDSCVERAFVSVRPDQRADQARARYPQVVDAHEGLGPIAGIAAAQALVPSAAWLVLGCDLPYVRSGTVAHLIAHRDPARSATAYRSSHDGLPEPLCAIYEPRSAAAIRAWVAAGRNCPRKFLLSVDTELLTEPAARALDNINTPQEYGSAMDLVRQKTAPAAAATRNLSVQYYALLREQAGRREETLLTSARTPAELYAELSRRYPFSLPAEMLRVAINSEFRDWATPLQEGEAVVFIPPVAGG